MKMFYNEQRDSRGPKQQPYVRYNFFIFQMNSNTLYTHLPHSYTNNLKQLLLKALCENVNISGKSNKCIFGLRKRERQFHNNNFLKNDPEIEKKLCKVRIFKNGSFAIFITESFSKIISDLIPIFEVPCNSAQDVRYSLHLSKFPVYS